MTVAEAAEEHRKLNNPGSYKGPWRNEANMAMVEPMTELTSRVFDGLVFVGPAQSGKTDALILNFILYSVKVDPMDMIVYSPTNAAARDFSTRRIDRLHRHSKISDMLLADKDADNKFDKQYSSGMLLSISWPSVTELAGRPIPRVLITDFDRIDDDIGGDGNAYDLGSKRTTSFRSFAMTVAESSPSRLISEDAKKWVRHTPHEAPPCGGILALYNRGDRRRWYWPCPDCGSYFEGSFRLLTWDKHESNEIAASETVRMECPVCDYAIHPNERYGMQQKGRWLKDGQSIEKDGTVYGDGPRTSIASFWMNGTAAMFVTWTKLVQLYITAHNEFEKTGSEEALKKFYNNDLGEPYMPKSMESTRLPEDLQSRAENLGGSQEEPVVPEGVRFLIATVDVQKNMFIVQVQGICPGEPFDMVVIDRFQLKLNTLGRQDSDGQIAWVKPGTYLDDWDQILDKVIHRTYPLGDGSGRRMAVKVTGCDSGGKAGVTSNAYAFFRRLREKGYGGRFQLIKGDGKPGAPRTKISFPDSSDSKNKAAAQGDVPVLMVASNALKDELSNRLDSMVPGRGLIRFPKWLPDWFYVELCSEIRTDKGWEKPKHARNESWDLLYYCIGICLGGFIKVEGIRWGTPPAWAEEWSKNNLISAAGQEERFAKPDKPGYDMAKIAALGRVLA
jgi:phage terminase large subunit GpA-like protein